MCGGGGVVGVLVNPGRLVWWCGFRWVVGGLG